MKGTVPLPDKQVGLDGPSTEVHHAVPSARIRVRLLALTVLVSGTAVYAGSKNTHEGKVVNVKGDKLTMETKGKEHSHAVAPTAKITCDGKQCKLNDLKAGTFVRVTTDNLNRANAHRGVRQNHCNKTIERNRILFTFSARPPWRWRHAIATAGGRVNVNMSCYFRLLLGVVSACRSPSANCKPAR